MTKLAIEALEEAVAEKVPEWPKYYIDVHIPGAVTRHDDDKSAAHFFHVTGMTQRCPCIGSALEACCFSLTEGFVQRGAYRQITKAEAALIVGRPV